MTSKKQELAGITASDISCTPARHSDMRQYGHQRLEADDSVTSVDGVISDELNGESVSLTLRRYSSSICLQLRQH